MWKIYTQESLEFFEATEWRYQNFDRNRYRDFFSDTKFTETETETLKKLAKVSKPRSFETEMSISACNHASFEPDPLLLTLLIWDSFLRWQSSSKKQIFFWHKPGLVWIEKYQLVEFVGNPLKISPILCGTPPHRTNLKTEFTFIVFWIFHFSRTTTKGFPY